MRASESGSLPHQVLDILQPWVSAVAGSGREMGTLAMIEGTRASLLLKRRVALTAATRSALAAACSATDAFAREQDAVRHEANRAQATALQALAVLIVELKRPPAPGARV